MANTCLKINSLNVRGIRNEKKRKTLFRWLKSNYKGFALLQETHSTVECETEWIKDWGNEVGGKEI